MQARRHPASAVGSHSRSGQAITTATGQFRGLTWGGSRTTMLDDGRYQLRFDTTRITSEGNGNILLLDDDLVDDAIRTFEFHRLLADFDGDAVIDLDDRTRWFERYPSRQDDLLYDIAFDVPNGPRGSGHRGAIRGNAAYERGNIPAKRAARWACG